MQASTHPQLFLEFSWSLVWRTSQLQHPSLQCPAMQNAYHTKQLVQHAFNSSWQSCNCSGNKTPIETHCPTNWVATRAHPKRHGKLHSIECRRRKGKWLGHNAYTRTWTFQQYCRWSAVASFNTHTLGICSLRQKIPQSL